MKDESRWQVYVLKMTAAGKGGVCSFAMLKSETGRYGSAMSPSGTLSKLSNTSNICLTA
ncbi:hypothetical protein SH528x_004941 [Novipirellula sp. SH528]|uniref:hypothetical protein n=1 Tax=Novipirellula sp. SH528 TaxID=3454466 RepID=UPI003F9F594A